MTKRIARAVAKIERDRNAVERIGMKQARRIGAQARIHAIAALKTGNDPVQAIRNVLLGNSRLDLPGIVPLLTDLMVTAHLYGRRRTVVNVAPQMRASDGIKLAGTVYDEALEFLNRRLVLDDVDLDILSRQYRTEALRVTNVMEHSIEESVQRALLETTREGLGVRDGVKALREAFAAEGLEPQSDHQLQAVFRTQTQISYSAGRENSLRDPAIQDILWGFEFSAIVDDRTTDICLPLDGMRRPKDDPIWDTHTPPLHYNCRSTKLEIFNEERFAEATEIPEAEPAPGFAFNPGDVFRDLKPAA